MALLTTLFHGMRAEGLWSDEPGTHVLELAAPFYNVYETADGRYVTIAAGEPKFYAELLRRLGLDELRDAQADPATWPDAKAQLAAVFKTKTRDEWCELLERHRHVLRPGVDARRGAEPSAQRGALDVRDGRRRRPAGCCPPVQRGPPRR